MTACVYALLLNPKPQGSHEEVFRAGNARGKSTIFKPWRQCPWHGKLSKHNGSVDGWNQRFIGCACGQVGLDQKDPWWVGAEDTDNIAVELTALVMAQN